MIDLIYLTHNRLEFTQASFEALLANTDWSLVNQLWLFDEGSTDGTKQYLKAAVDRRAAKVRAAMFLADYSGGPVTCMNDWLDEPGCDIFAKIDNDVIVPPGWLNAAVGVMEAFPKLGFLGIEPPASRTPAPWADRRRPVPKPEEEHPSSMRYRHWAIADVFDISAKNPAYAQCDAIGGVGLMRRSAFGKQRMKPHSTYGGFTDWQIAHPEVTKGWIVPPLKLFLLDRLPLEPWASLSKRYIEEGLQRPWTNYEPKDADALWSWWKS